MALHEHLGYLEDTRRLELYKQAVAQVVRPGDTVADVGCGTAVLGLLCLQAGAAHIHGIDASAALEIARRALALAGRAGQCSWYPGLSFQTQLPEAVDVVICDHVGYFGFDYGLIELVADARKRLLKPGGRIVPERLKLQLGAVESADAHLRAEAWAQPAIPPEFHCMREHGVNTKYSMTLPPEAVAAGPMCLAEIDLMVDQPDFFSWTVELQASRDAELHGLAGWFECELAPGVWMSNSPLSDQAIQRPQAFLPFDAPLPVKEGDTLTATVMARPVDNLIAWEVRHPASGRSFSHSTWKGELLNAEQLQRRHPAHRPVPNRDARAMAAVLACCDGQRTVAQIRELLQQAHPDLFPKAADASRWVDQALHSFTE